MPMRVFMPWNGGRVDRTRAQVGFFVVAFLGFLFFGDRFGAVSVGKHVRTGIQVPTNARLSSARRDRGQHRF